MFSEGSESSYISSYSVSSSASSFGNNEGITGMYECALVFKACGFHGKTMEISCGKKHGSMGVKIPWFFM